MWDHPMRRTRVLVDLTPRGDIAQVGYEVWDAGVLLGTGCAGVGPFDDMSDVQLWLAENIGVQLRLW
jgi:hypothetical protein